MRKWFIRMRKYIRRNNLLTTFKISAAAILAIIISDYLGLKFALASGIVAILSVAPTKKDTIRTAISRFLAFIVALVIAFICFEILGYGQEAFFLYIIIFVFICQVMEWNSAMAMNSVLISHFLTFGKMDLATVINECLIFFVGAGLGIIVNLHLRKDTDYVERMKAETDKQIKLALHRMSKRILTHDLEDYNGVCFKKLRRSVRKAKNIAEENFMNQFGTTGKLDIEYISMREKQINVLYNMYKRVRVICTTPVTAKEISAYIEKIAHSYHRDNSGRELLIEFDRLNCKLKDSPLPKDRKEFEDRAELYALMRDIEEFLTIKTKFTEKNS